MAKDHYVAQTYLKHFGIEAEGSRMQGYRKPAGNSFPCYPKDVCHEWDGDQNPDFFTSKPEIRGDFRAIFEPRWNPALAALMAGRLDDGDRFVMSAMAAMLMSCTPAWRRASAAMHDSFATGFAIAGHKLTVEAGHTPDLNAESIAALERGEIRLETDRKYIEAMNTRHLLEHTWMTYNQDWTVLLNQTPHPFVTSDNPSAMRVIGGRGGPVERYLPITPQLCVQIPFTRTDIRPLDREKPSFDLSRPSMGKTRYARIDAQSARNINRLVVQNAESLVLSSVPDDKIGRLVEKYGTYGVDIEFIEHEAPEEKAVYHEVRVEVRDRGRK